MIHAPRLAKIGLDGLRELGPALLAFLHARDRDVRLAPIWGPHATQLLLALGAGAAIAGQLFARLGPALPFKVHVHWGAVVLSLVLGVRIRAFLFRSGRAIAADFAELALSLAPALFGLLVTTVALDLALGPAPLPHDAFADPRGIGLPLLALTQLAGIVAAVTIAVASLCYTRNWISALGDLAVRLAVFKILVWVTALVTIEIGIVGLLLSALVTAITGWHVPAWLGELADQISYAVLLLSAYGFVVGGTWRVCRETYGELLATGDVKVAPALEALAKRRKPPAADGPAAGAGDGR